MNQIREGGAMTVVGGHGSSASGAPLNPPPATGQAGPSDSTGRIRGSCEACAKSKVKCGKEKPACERCLMRGTECVYLISRRPGRVPGANSRRQHARNRADRDNDSSNTSSSSRNISISGDQVHQRSGSDSHSGVMVNFPQSPSPSTTGSESTSNEIDLVSSNAGSFMSTPNTEDQPEYLFGSSFDPNYFQLMSSLDDGMYSTLMDLEDSLGPVASWPADGGNSNLQGEVFVGQDAINYDMSRPRVNTADLAQISPRDSPMSSSAAFDFNQMLSNSACVFEPTSSMPFPAAVDTTAQATPTPASNEPCDCVSQALDILKVVSRPQPYCNLRKGRSHSTGSVLLQNKHSIESTSSLLVCSTCKEDRLLLMVILMIAMKLLERYTYVIASRSPGQVNAGGSSQSSGNVSDRRYSSAMELDQRAPLQEGLEDDEPAAPRESMQSVLRELIHVQKLISLLPARLRSLRDVPALGRDVGGAQQGMMGFSVAVLPLSERALSLIENDVRSNLKALSADIRSRLKNS